MCGPVTCLHKHTFLSPAQICDPLGSQVKQYTAPAVLLTLPCKAENRHGVYTRHSHQSGFVLTLISFPVETLNTFTCPLLFPTWNSLSQRIYRKRNIYPRVFFRLLPRPIPSFSMLHAEKCFFLHVTLKNWEWPGDEARSSSL